MKDTRVARAKSRMLSVLAGGAAATLIAAGASLGSTATAAHAADNPNITVTASPLVTVNGRGMDTKDSLTVWRAAALNFKWDASNANPQPGDSFYIGLPEEFKTRERIEELPFEFDGTSVGKCELAERRITCTFNDSIRGKINIHGEGRALLTAQHATNSGVSNFDLNGKVTPVPLPNNEGIKVVGNGYHPWSFGKNTTSITYNASRIHWSIGFGADHVAKALGRVADGSTQTITFVDTLSGPEHTFDSKENIAAIFDQYISKTDNKAKLNVPGFTVNVEVLAPNKAKFSVTGPFQPDTNYRLRYTTKPDGDKIKPGVVYGNTAAVEGTNLSSENSNSYVDSFKITVVMEDGFGSFDVTKKVTGGAVNQVANGTSFTGKVSWELPNGKSAADYPGWQAPSNPVDLAIEVGKQNVYNGTFPVGTKITLTEDLNSANPANPAISWSEPVFTVGGKDSKAEVSFVITNKESTHVELLNTAEPAKPTPPVPTPPTPTPGGDGGVTPPPANSDSPQPVKPAEQPAAKPALAKTGAEFNGMYLTAGAGLLLFGAGMMAAQVKRRKARQ